MTITLATLLLIAAVIVFVVDAVRTRALLAIGLALFAASFLVDQL